MSSRKTNKALHSDPEISKQGFGREDILNAPLVHECLFRCLTSQGRLAIGVFYNPGPWGMIPDKLPRFEPRFPTATVNLVGA